MTQITIKFRSKFDRNRAYKYLRNHSILSKTIHGGTMDHRLILLIPSTMEWCNMSRQLESAGFEFTEVN